MDAVMDGDRVIAESIGKKKKVSEMELIVLCNFARVGLLSVFASLDEPTGSDAEQELERLLGAIREAFDDSGKRQGLLRLASSCAAILAGDKLGRYVVEH